MNTIRFNTGNEAVVLSVDNIFEDVYNSKPLLRIFFNENNTSWEDIQKLKLNTGDISYYEEEELKTIYSGYAHAAGGFTNNYRKNEQYPAGFFDVTIVQASEFEARLAAVEQTLEALLLA